MNLTSNILLQAARDLLLAGSTRQQNVGRINKAADRGDGDEDEDKDEDKDEIPNYAVLVTALPKRVGVSSMQDFQRVAMSVHVWRQCPLPMQFFSRPLIGPQIT